LPESTKLAQSDVWVPSLGWKIFTSSLASLVQAVRGSTMQQGHTKCTAEVAVLEDDVNGGMYHYTIVDERNV
jgi:hypothetical protein